MLRQRLLHQGRAKYVYGRNVCESLKQHWKNSTIPSEGVSSYLLTYFSHWQVEWKKTTLEVYPWILTCLSSVAFSLSRTGSLTVFSFATHFLSFGNKDFLSALCFSLRLASILTITHPWLFTGLVVVIFLCSSCSSCRRERHVPACYVRQSACLVWLF